MQCHHGKKSKQFAGFSHLMKTHVRIKKLHSFLHLFFISQCQVKWGTWGVLVVKSKKLAIFFFVNFPKGLGFLSVIVMTKMIRMKSQKKEYENTMIPCKKSVRFYTLGKVPVSDNKITSWFFFLCKKVWFSMQFFSGGSSFNFGDVIMKWRQGKLNFSNAFSSWEEWPEL